MCASALAVIHSAGPHISSRVAQPVLDCDPVASVSHCSGITGIHHHSGLMVFMLLLDRRKHDLLMFLIQRFFFSFGTCDLVAMVKVISGWKLTRYSNHKGSSLLYELMP